MKKQKSKKTQDKTTKQPKGMMDREVEELCFSFLWVEKCNNWVSRRVGKVSKDVQLIQQVTKKRE